MLPTSGVFAQNYEYSTNYQPYLSQIGVTSALHANLSPYIAGSTNLAAKNLGIAILDGKADATHPDLTGRLTVYQVYSGTFTKADTHATHVSGLVGASRNNAGIAGVDPFATIFSIPVFDDTTWVPTDVGKIALDKAQSLGAKVVNMSYSPTARGDVFINSELTLFHTYLGSMVLVRAAGNSGANMMNEYYAGNASTDLANVLIVGSVNSRNQLSSFSNRPGSACIAATGNCTAANKIQNFFIVAPGENDLSDLPGNKYGAMSGTSMATPLVTGAAGLVFQKAYAGNTLLTPADVVSILERSATDLGTRGIDSVYGWGLLNVSAALSPIGMTRVATTSRVSTSQQSLSTSSLTSSSTLGSKAAFNSLLSGMVVFDDYGRGFTLNAVQPAAPRSTLIGDATTALYASIDGAASQQAGRQGVQFFQSPSQNSPFSGLSFADDRVSVSSGLGSAQAYFVSAGAPVLGTPQSQHFGSHFFTASGDVGREFENGYFGTADFALTPQVSVSTLYAHGSGQNFDPSSNWVDAINQAGTAQSDLAMMGGSVRLGDTRHLEAAIGLLREDSAVLGIDNRGAFSFGPSAMTQLFNLGYSQAFDQRFSVDAFVQMGRTQSGESADTIFSPLSDVWSRKAGISFLSKQIVQPNDLFQVSLISPWQIVSGEVDAHVAIGREFDGTVDYVTRRVSLGSPSIPLDLGFTYAAQQETIGYGVSLSLRNHDASKASVDEAVASAGVHWRF